MYDIRNLPGNKHLRAACLVLLGALCAVQVNAQAVAVPDAAFQRFLWTTTGANSQSVTVGTGGVPVASPTGSGTIAADGTKSLAYSRNATWRNGSNNPVSGSIAAKIPINAKTAKLLTAGMKVIPLLSTGYALFDFARELGFNPTKDSNGDISVTQTPASGTIVPGVAPASLTQYLAPCQTAYGQACAVNSYYFGPGLSVYCGGTINTNQGLYCHVVQRANNAGPSSYNYTVSREFVSQASIQSSVEALEDAIAAKSGWPSSSSIAQAVRDAAQATGQTVDVELPKITGPATSPGTTTTTQNPNGTTTTNNTTHNHIYNDNRVTNTTTRSSSVTNNTTGATETTTTTEEPIEEPSECEKNPNALNCADLDTPEVDIPKTEKTITFNAENLGFAGGSCPANVTQNINGAPVVLFNWTSHCATIVNYAKPMILALATFAALMIIFGAKTE